MNVSYRRFVQIASENNLQRMLCIKRIPQFTTLQKFIQKLDKKLLEKMLRACYKLLKLKDIEVSINGTGFSNTNPSHYYFKRVDGVKVKNWAKTVLLADNKSKLILNVRTHLDKSHEVKDFISMIKELKKSLNFVLPNKGYDSKDNRNYCWNNNIEVHIPLRDYKHSRYKHGHKPFLKERKKACKLFNKQKYRFRNIIESINSAIKRTLGSYINLKKSGNQQKQVTIKALTYNLQIINNKIKIWLFIN